MAISGQHQVPYDFILVERLPTTICKKTMEGTKSRSENCGHEKQRTNVTLRRVRETIVAVEKQ